MKEQVAIQALVALPAFGTPSTQTLQKSSTEAIPFQILVPGSISSKIEKVIHYGDITLDEEIIIPKFDWHNDNRENRHFATSLREKEASGNA